MKFNKVVFVRYLPLTKAIYTDLYFEVLLQNGIEVTYLDLTTLFFPDKITPDEFGFNGIIKINSYEQLEKYLNGQENENVLYVSIMTFEARIFKLFRLFTRFNLKLGVFSRGVFPDSAETKNKIKLTRIFKSLYFQRVNVFIKNKITILAKKSGFIKPYDYVFKAGEYGYFGLGIGSEIDFGRAKIIDINTVDYDQFLLFKNLQSVCTGEYIVFLDQYLPFHTDASFLNIKTVKPEPYFKEVNSFFDRIEVKTGLKVIIAAHPKAECYKEINPYNDRALFFNQSNNLVKNATLVLTHASTAICFPICYHKKLVLLVSDYLNEVLPHFFEVAKSIREACGATIISIDKGDDIQIKEDIDLEKYNDFRYKYLTSKKSENQLSQDIFINFLKKNGSDN